MSRAAGFDRDAAVTRSLLGYGVVAGVCYLTIGLILAATRDGFDLARHPLSLLMLGEGGWMQRANLIVAGAMVLAASVGFARALRASSLGRRAATLLGVYGGALVVSGVFAPDPMEGFPPGSTDGGVSLHGLLHLASGAVGFVSLAWACLVVAAWSSTRGASGMHSYSRLSAAIIAGGFVTGAALSSGTAGIVALWAAVVAGWLWLTIASIDVYRTVPHPDATVQDAASSGGGSSSSSRRAP